MSRASFSFRALSPGMSLVTACMCCMSCMFSTAAEDDPDAWDASDLDMFTQFSEAEGEGEGREGWGGGEGGGMGRGGQTPMRLVDGRCPGLFFFTPRHRTRTPHRQQCRRRRHSGGGANAA